MPEAKPVYLIADQLQYDHLDAIGDRSDPTITKGELSQFYQRRSAVLQHKKHKLLQRWAQSHIKSQQLDQISQVIDKSIAYLQIEQDSVASRLMRLEPDDRYEGSDVADRPKPATSMQVPQTKSIYKHSDTSSLYQESEVKFMASSMRQDDFEVFIRHTSYENKINRPGLKLISQLKWLPAQQKYEIWGEARKMMFESKDTTKKNRFRLLFTILEEIKNKVVALGGYDEKVISATSELYIYHLKDREFISRKDQMINNHKYEHTEPSKLFASNTELKIYLKEYAQEFELNSSQVDLDKGQQFTYQLQSFFPQEFEKQCQAMTFDWEDSGNHTDKQIVERLTRTLGLTKDQMLESIGHYSAIQRHQSILSALNVGKTGATDSTLKELTESELNKDQFLRYNLVRKLKTIEFFSLNESETRVRRADWLELVCWTPNISVAVQKQNQLLSGQDNLIDRLLRSAFDFVDVKDSSSVNKVLEDAAEIHIQKIQDIQKRIAQGQSYQNPIKSSFHDNKTEQIYATLNAATNPAAARHKVEGSDQPPQINQQQQVLNIDSLSLNLTKCFYSLRIIKTRKLKIQLLYVLNYFRAIQRILANDVRELLTREKSLGDQKNLIDAHFGKNSKGISITKLQGPAGPGDIFNLNVERELDTKQRKKKEYIDPITLKAYKYNNSYNPTVLSTCPVVPKHHRTFGTPTIYEQVSAENNRQQQASTDSDFQTTRNTQRDRIVVDAATKQIFVLNEYGMKVVYEEAIQDLAELEEEMIKIGSFYINNYEYVLAMNEIMENADANRPSSLIDRPEIVVQLYKAEVEYQFAKVMLVEQIMEAYEHILDPLEHIRTLQMIVDVMAQRPRLNMQSNFFDESYASETKAVNMKCELFQEFISLQKEIETNQNRQVQDFVESKVRRMEEAHAEYFKLKEEIVKIQQYGSDEAFQDETEEEIDDQIKERLRMMKQQEKEKQDRLQEIAKRHITEYANEQFGDFTEILGLQNIKMDQLYEKFDQKEPIIIDSIRENAFFVKMIEGYPDVLGQNKQIGTELGLHTSANIGVSDFFQGLELLPRFNAAIFQVMAQMEKDTLPENSFALSCLEVCTLREIRIQLQQARKEYQERISSYDLVGQYNFEDDFYLGSAEKLYSTMRHLHYETEGTNLYKLSNPMVIANFDITNVQNYNFPRLRSKEVIDSLKAAGVSEKNINENFNRKACEMAKNIVARPLVILKTEENAQENYEKKEVKAPSMMIMSCNLLEVLRLREEIVLRMHETNILTKIYSRQADYATKNNKIYIPDIIPFETAGLLSKDFVNMMDMNDGINLKFDPRMPFMEFSPQFRANLDFKSESCIKALFTDLGLEELRAVLHCQIMQQHLLTVAVRQNDLLICKSLKGLKEIELLVEKNITTPNSSIDLLQIISSNTDGQSQQNIQLERTRLQQSIIKGLTDCFYMALSKKSRDRQLYGKKFVQVVQQLKNTVPAPKPELSLRILRSYRVLLCHQYCQSIIQQVHRDSLKIQVLETCNTLRMRALLLPTKSQIFKLGRSDFQENISFEAFQNLQNLEGIITKQQMSIQQVMQGSGVCHPANTVFYIPTTEEICVCDRKPTTVDDLKKEIDNIVGIFAIDKQISSMVMRPNLLGKYKEVYKLEKGYQYGVRKTWFQEANNYADKESYSLLLYFSNILAIFDLEYTMMRNHAKGAQCYELEQISQSGICFWDHLQSQVQQIEKYQIQNSNQLEQHIENTTAFTVVNKIYMRKKVWIDLTEDLQLVVNQMQKLNTWMRRLPLERRTLPYICDMLTLQHQSIYLRMLNGIEHMIEYQLEKESDEYFAKLFETRSLVTRQNLNEIHMIRSNGYFVTQGTVNPASINISSRSSQEFLLFQNQQQFVIDEKALIPRQVRVLKRIYGYQNQRNQRDTATGYQMLLDTAFYNMDDQLRGQLTSTFEEGEEMIQDYLVFKGLDSQPGEQKIVNKGLNFQQDVLLAQVEIFNFKIEAAHLERVLMSWCLGGQALPTGAKEFKIQQRQLRTNNMLTILSERDVLNAQYWNKQQRKPPPNPDAKVERTDLVLSPRSTTQINETKSDKPFAYVNRINILRAESQVFKQILEVNLVKVGIDTIEREHAALIACFDAVANDSKVAAYVNPYQQFASVQYPTVDKIPHLDVVSKVGFLQGFLTRLRNRCTEVETLTSGPGIVFSIKDFNECLTIFAKQLVKYSEEELRGRCETQNLREHQYHHLIYIKEMEALYYRAKCEQFLTNIDAIINCKMTSQGNQMIYELDVTSRELSTLKDHYYLMERNIREEIRREFNKAILDKDQRIAEQKHGFGQFRNEVSKAIREQIEDEIGGLDQRVKAISDTNIRRKKDTQDSKKYNAENPELMHEIVSLTKVIRKQKILSAMRRVLLQEKHFQELTQQKEKLTQNKSLWDQLAESEKREQITQQELQLTQKNLNHYERLIEKLYTQLEHINNQKMRLEEYKKNKAKRITELESKMKDLEILENLDLNKILEQLRTRDKKIYKLDRLEDSLNERIEILQESHRQQQEELKRQLAVERKAKLDAFEKLESMRIEMKSLEGKDNIKNDLWKSKCKELYDICRDLEKENETLKLSVTNLQAQMKHRIETGHTYPATTISRMTDGESAYQIPMTREQIILQRQSLTKPYTAKHTARQHRILSGNNQQHETAISAHNQLGSLERLHIDPQGLTSSLQGLDQRQKKNSPPASLHKKSMPSRIKSVGAQKRIFVSADQENFKQNWEIGGVNGVSVTNPNLKALNLLTPTVSGFAQK